MATTGGKSECRNPKFETNPKEWKMRNGGDYASRWFFGFLHQNRKHRGVSCRMILEIVASARRRCPRFAGLPCGRLFASCCYRNEMARLSSPRFGLFHSVRFRSARVAAFSRNCGIKMTVFGEAAPPRNGVCPSVCMPKASLWARGGKRRGEGWRLARQVSIGDWEGAAP